MSTYDDALIERATPREVAARVLGRHQRIPVTDGTGGWRCCGCDKLRGETDGPNSPRHAAHVAAELIAALREAGLLVEGETVTEWTSGDLPSHPRGRLAGGHISTAKYAEFIDRAAATYILVTGDARAAHRVAAAVLDAVADELRAEALEQAADDPDGITATCDHLPWVQLDGACQCGWLRHRAAQLREGA